MQAIRTQNDFMIACASVIQMEDTEQAFEMAEWIQEQTFGWMVDEDTRHAMNRMMNAVNEAIAIRDEVQI